MPKGNRKVRWQFLCAAMVEHGHGRSADISAASAQRRPPANARAEKKDRVPETSGRKLPYEMLSMIAV